jgi:hypothetical protein
MQSQFNVQDSGFTTEQLTYFETEMRKYKLPWLTKILKKYGMPVFRNAFPIALVIITVFGLIYNHNPYNNQWMWTMDKCIALFFILGFGGFALIAHLMELYTTNKLRRRLGLTKQQFDMLVIAFQITGM